MVASLPVLVKRTTSADGTMRRKRSAASTSAEVAAAKCAPSDIACETTETSVGCACPWMSAPKDIMKSTYSFPSESQTCDPWPRSRKIGPDVYTAAPREGELTPSTSDCCARSNHCWERARLRVVVVCAIPSLNARAVNQSAVPPPSTTRAAPVMKEESSDASKSTALVVDGGGTAD